MTVSSTWTGLSAALHQLCFLLAQKLTGLSSVSAGLPCLWGGKGADGAPGEAPHYVCETSGKAYHEPPQFPYFVRLAGSVIYARLFAKETRPWVHAVLKEINSHASRENPCTWAAFVVQVVETLLKHFPSTCTRLPCIQIR